MQKQPFVVKYVAVKNCFVYLPEIWARRLDCKVNGIKISHYNNDYYVSWRPISGNSETLGISATFARALNVKEGDEVNVSCVPEPPFLSTITVTPRSVQDWEIVKYQADKVQSVLLDQISLVAKDQTIVVWLSKGLLVTLLIDAISPDFVYGAIGNGTEVHVTQQYAQPDRKLHSKADDTAVQQMRSTVRNIFSNIPFITLRNMCDTKANGVYEESNDIRCWMKSNDIPMVPQTFRVYSLSAVGADAKTSGFSVESPYDVFVHEWNAPANVLSTKYPANRLYRIRKVCEDPQHFNTTSTNFLRTNRTTVPKQSPELVVRLFVIGSENAHSSQMGQERVTHSVHKKIYLSTNLRRNLKLRVGSKVVLESMKDSEESLASIEVFPSAMSVTRQVVEEFLLNTAGDKGILINTRSRIYLKYGTSCMVLCSPQECSYAILDSSRLKNVVLNVNDVSPPEFETWEDTDGEFQNSDLDTISLPPLEPLLAECRMGLDLGLCLTDAFLGRNSRCDPGNILICGDLGVGKSAICKVLQADMHRAPHSVYVHLIECKALKGKKVEAFQKIMSAAMAECVYYQPSVLFLDDLEVITSSPSDDEPNTPDAINAARILDVIFNTASEYQASHYVSIVATCTAMNKIGPKLKSPRGIHLFRTVLTMRELEKDSRINILKLALQSHVRAPQAIDWDYYGNKTEGWVAQDLVDFAEKAAFAVWKRHAQERTKSLTVVDEDLRDTLDHYKPMSLHGVQLYDGSNHDWSHIGGLKKVKEILKQLFEWPLKYPELYRNAPIKNQNGVLLYGMPGTGKTILAGAIAKQCGLNLISVKGPELLSKYIGASEEAVRQVFEKARQVKPCILFFDEFDSLAPRRGHDSTGVTDRVVNQLLTQLDGVEGREGVAIVAASSRPDLLDPALLRPGRLDKSLLCPLPDEMDREEILVALCKVQRVNADNLDLKKIAKLSSGFTGADLNATITQAKYAAFESSLENHSSDELLRADLIEVTQEHIIESLKSTNPSVSFAEQERYRRIFSQFGKSSSIDTDAAIKQKTTLA